MPPPRLRLRLQRPQSHLRQSSSPPAPAQQCRYASAATTAVTPAPSIEATIHAPPPIQRFPPGQPPSHKPPEFRKSQLHRQYTSLLRSSPLILLFQHNNLTSPEWMGIRRELAAALRRVDEQLAAATPERRKEELADGIKLQIIQTGIFAAALRIVEFYDPSSQSATSTSTIHPTDPSTPTSAPISPAPLAKDDPAYTHSLSRTAYNAARASRTVRHGLEPLLSGPLAVVAFPTLSPAHLAAVLRTLAPDKQFAAPRRRVNPTYHEPVVQAGLAKLMLLGARMEGRVFDDTGVRWVGGIEGGLDGLRSQLIAVLESFGAGLTRTLEGLGRSVYFTLEGRKGMLEDETKGKGEEKAE